MGIFNADPIREIISSRGISYVGGVQNASMQKEIKMLLIFTQKLKVETIILGLSESGPVASLPCRTYINCNGLLSIHSYLSGPHICGRLTRLGLGGPNKEKELRRGFNHLIQGTGADISYVMVALGIRQDYRRDRS